MKNRTTIAGILASLVLLPGCATITSNEMQTVSLTTKGSNGGVVEKADCTLSNDKGQWQATSPSQVAVHRSAQDLVVSCRKEGAQDGMLRAISRVGAGMFGNIIFGGGIGAIIDHTKGTAYNYPDDLPVVMGTNSTIDRQQTASAEAEAERAKAATVTQ